MNSSRVAIKTSRGIEFLRIEDILCCVAKGRYTQILTTEGKEYLVPRILKEIEGKLPEDDFFRTHKSFLFNLNHIVHYQKNHETPITLLNDVKIRLSKRRKQEFQRIIKERVKTI